MILTTRHFAKVINARSMTADVFKYNSFHVFYCFLSAPFQMLSSAQNEYRETYVQA